MTRDREIERVLEAWLEPGPSVMPDRVFDAVLDRIEREPQRRALRLTTRFHAMNSTLKLAAVTVLATVFGLGTVSLLATTSPTSPGSSPSPGGVCADVFCPAGTLSGSRVFHSATLLDDGRVLVSGGQPTFGGPALDTAEIWDSRTMTFRSAGEMTEARQNPSAILLRDGRVLIVGGYDKVGDPTASAEIWDPETGTISGLPPMAEARANPSITLLPDGRVLIVGGVQAGGGDHVPLDSAEIWDPATELFSPAGTMAELRGGHMAALLPDGRVLVMGGFDASGSTRLATAEIWDPATMSFSPAGSMTVGRSTTATSLDDGRVLVVGGDTPESADTADIWDPATESFSSIGLVAPADGYHSTTLLQDGRVLVLGTSAQTWDPAIGAFSFAGTVPDPRNGHTATLLPDGMVLIVGGVSNWLGLDSSLLYDPTAVVPSPSPGASDSP